MTTERPPFGRLGAVVLAGGRSGRFGRDKLVEPIAGRPMVRRAIDAVVATSPDVDLVVVTAPGAALDLPGGVRRAEDPVSFEGPLAGLASGLAVLDRSVEVVLVVGGDMPSLVPAVLRRMVARLDADGDAAVVVLQPPPDDADARRGVRPLPSVLRREAAARAVDALLATGERRLRAMTEVLPTVTVPWSAWGVDDPDGATLRDVDVPGDLPG